MSIPAILLAVLPVLASAEDSLPRLKLEKGSETIFDVTGTTRMSLGPAGARTQLTLRCSLLVVGTEDDQTTLRVTWTEVRGQVGIPFMVVHFDSAREVDSKYPKVGGFGDKLAASIVEDLKAPHLALQGFSYDVVIDDRGAILELPGVDEKLAELKRTLRRAGNHRTVKALSTEEGLRWQVHLLIPTRPPGEAVVGAEWETKEVTGLGNSRVAVVETSLRRSVKEIGEGRASVEWSGEPRVTSGKGNSEGSTVEGLAVRSMEDGLPLDVNVVFDLHLSRKRWFKVVDQDLRCEYRVVRVKSD